MKKLEEKFIRKIDQKLPYNLCFFRGDLKSGGVCYMYGPKLLKISKVPLWHYGLGHMQVLSYSMHIWSDGLSDIMRLTSNGQRESQCIGLQCATHNTSSVEQGQRQGCQFGERDCFLGMTCVEWWCEVLGEDWEQGRHLSTKVAQCGRMHLS